MKFFSNKEITTLKAELATITTDRDSLLAKVKDMEGKVDANKDYVALELDRNNLFNLNQSLTEQVNQFNDKVVALTEQHEATVNELNDKHVAEVATFKKTISDLEVKCSEAEASSEMKAIKTLSQIGVPEDKLPVGNVETLTAEGCYNKWQSLQATDKVAAQQFYNSNRETIKNFVGYKG